MSAIELHHVIEGPSDAPALVLAGSLGSSLEMWDPLVPLLTGSFRVIRYDQRGHGRSPVPPGPYTMSDLGADLIALLDRLGLARASLCGLSLGGMVSMWVAAHAPDRLDRLTLVSTSARLGPAEGWRERAALVRSQGTRTVAPAVIVRWLTPAFAARNPALAAWLVDMVATTPAEGYAACCEAIAGWDGTKLLPAIGARTLVVVGRDDPATPPAHAYALGAAIPGAHVVALDPAAHLLAVERPEALARLLLDHTSDREVSESSGPGDTDRERAARGEAMRRAVLGDAHVDRALARVTPFSAPFQELITRYPWGEIWTRPGLSRAERSIITLTVLATLQHEEELAMHVVAALRNGVTPEQIREVLLHLTAYAGVPVGNRAFAVAERALRDAGELPGPAPEARSDDPHRK